jgi:4-aminobutyrate aminotransferase-like enzyme
MLRNVKRDRKLNKRLAVKMKTKLKKIATFIWEKIKSQSGIRHIDKAKFVGDLKTS